MLKSSRKPNYRAGMITADKVNEMIDYAKNFDETDRQILLNFLRNQTGGK